MKKYLLVLLLFIAACTTFINQNNRRTATSLDALDAEGAVQILKVHLKNGGLCVLEKWELAGDTLRGKGVRYSPLRVPTGQGDLALPLADIGLYEMNQVPGNLDGIRGAGLGAQFIGNVAVLIFCLANPKACYGSCPTFYLPGQENIHQAIAEGFSESTLPSLERRDVDALRTTAAGGKRWDLVMKNEAWETHAIDQLSILAAPKVPGTTVLHSTDDRFFRCLPARSPLRADCPEGDCLPALSLPDERERFSRTDSFDLAKREEIHLQFGAATAGEQALALHFRHTQVTTFLFYSALSYMGDEMVGIQTALERSGKLPAKIAAMKAHLGGIEVFFRMRPQDDWQRAGEVNEAGPIAINSQVVPFFLPVDAPSLEVKLRLSQGYWRLDFAGLASVQEEVFPAELSPVSLISDVGFRISESPQSEIPNPKSQINWLPLLAKTDGQRLASFPGEQWTIGFDLPGEAKEYELFLAPTGYYLEWTREVWKKDKNLWKLWRMMDLSKPAWKDLAVEYKTLEAGAEEVFWNSKVPVQ